MRLRQMRASMRCLSVDFAFCALDLVTWKTNLQICLILDPYDSYR